MRLASPSGKRWYLIACLTFIISLGIGIRLIRFTNPPLDLDAWR